MTKFHFRPRGRNILFFQNIVSVRLHYRNSVVFFRFLSETQDQWIPFLMNQVNILEESDEHKGIKNFVKALCYVIPLYKNAGLEKCIIFLSWERLGSRTVYRVRERGYSHCTNLDTNSTEENHRGRKRPMHSLSSLKFTYSRMCSPAMSPVQRSPSCDYK